MGEAYFKQYKNGDEEGMTPLLTPANSLSGDILRLLAGRPMERAQVVSLLDGPYNPRHVEGGLMALVDQGKVREYIDGDGFVVVALSSRKEGPCDGEDGPCGDERGTDGPDTLEIAVEAVWTIYDALCGERDTARGPVRDALDSAVFALCTAAREAEEALRRRQG